MNFGGTKVTSLWLQATSRFRKEKLPKVKSTESGKLEYLESVRGLAALAVVFAHIMSSYYPAAGGGPSLQSVNKTLENAFFGLPFGFLINGHFAVVIFFTLSGFVLTYKFFQSHDQKDLHKQLAKRYFRLAIPIFAIVMISYFLIANGAMSSVDKAAAITGSPEGGRLFHFVPDLWSALYDATIGVLVNGNASYNPVLWTMKIELAGSLLVFGFASLTGKLRKRWVLYILAVVFFNESYMTCFVLGMGLADLSLNTKFIDYARHQINTFYIYGCLLLLWVPACFLSFSTVHPGTIFHSLLFPGVDAELNFRFIHFFSAALLLAIILLRVEIQNILKSRALVFLGGISFALYLTHYLILHSVGDTTYVFMRGISGPNSSALVAALLVLLISLGVAIIWKTYIDDFSVKVSRRFARYFLK